MELVIIVLWALAVIIFIEAGYWIVLTLVRWTPVIIAGVAAGSFAAQHGADNPQSLVLGLLACLSARHALVYRRGFDLRKQGSLVKSKAALTDRPTPK